MSFRENAPDPRDERRTDSRLFGSGRGVLVVGALLAAFVAAALAYGVMEDKTTVINTPANTPPSAQQPPTTAPSDPGKPAE